MCVKLNPKQNQINLSNFLPNVMLLSTNNNIPIKLSQQADLVFLASL